MQVSAPELRDNGESLGIQTPAIFFCSKHTLNSPRGVLGACVCCSRGRPMPCWLPHLTVSPRDQASLPAFSLPYSRAGVQRLFPGGDGWWMERGGGPQSLYGVCSTHPHSPLPWPAPAPPRPTSLQPWKLVPQPRKMNLLEVSCLAVRASQLGAGALCPPLGLEGQGLDQRGWRAGPASGLCPREQGNRDREE